MSELFYIVDRYIISVLTASTLFFLKSDYDMMNVGANEKISCQLILMDRLSSQNLLISSSLLHVEAILLFCAHVPLLIECRL